MSLGVLAQVLGPDGLIVIVVVAIVLLFGGSKLPKLARSLGGASHEFKRAAETAKHSDLAAHPEIARPVTAVRPVEDEGKDAPLPPPSW
jgi:sec-independent protein translocase protein TatA